MFLNFLNCLKRFCIGIIPGHDSWNKNEHLFILELLLGEVLKKKFYFIKETVFDIVYNNITFHHLLQQLLVAVVIRNWSGHAWWSIDAIVF